MAAMLRQRLVMTTLVIVICLLPFVSSAMFSKLFKRYTCADREYDPDYLICCDEVLRPRFPGYKCCGNMGYDPKAALCCMETVVSHRFWMTCNSYVSNHRDGH
ncbi:hypothetical protein LSAT2_021924 [Lamellibrachia satsuma]|nr:hypothetical protein LSAT2_021924 [Lamellibrachia satsuma]